jgi:Domain of unknown function (DUF4399)
MQQMRRILILFGLALAGCGQQQSAPPAAPAAASPPAATAAAIVRKPAPPGAMAYVISPTDGATVTNPVRVVFGLKGMGVAPAGIDKPNTGHHHLIIDADLPPLDQPIPKDDQHLHFGGGQTETTLTLSPGKHTLRLLLGDNLHVPFDPPIVSDPVTIEVQ